MLMWIFCELFNDWLEKKWNSDKDATLTARWYFLWYVEVFLCNKCVSVISFSLVYKIYSFHNLLIPFI